MNGCIILFGITRGKAKECQESFQKYILEELDKSSIKYTTYLHAFELDFINASRSKENNVKVENPKDWQLFNPNFFTSNNQDEFDLTIDFDKFIAGKFDSWKTGHQNTKNLIRQLFSLQKSFSLIKQKHDFYFFSRLDLLYQNNNGLVDSIKDVVKNPKNNILYTPTWNKSTGLNDRIAISNYKVAKTYANRIDELIKLHKGLNSIHSERFLLNLSKKHKFENQFFPFYAARIRADGRIEKN